MGDFSEPLKLVKIYLHWLQGEIAEKSSVLADYIKRQI